MAKLATAFLCNFAEERGGVVYVLSAFINQMRAQSLPSRSQVTLVANFELEESDFGQPHLFVVTATLNDGEQLARIEGPTPPWPRPPEADPDLPITSSAIFPMSLEFRRQGLYWFDLSLDGEPLVHKPFKVYALMPSL
jgi:hypothetical protein